MRLICVLVAVVLAATSCSGDSAGDRDVYAAQAASIGESLATLGWNMSVANLRFDADYVLVDVEASPAQQGAPHAKPEDIRFGLCGALDHPVEADALGGCADMTSLAVQPLSSPNPDRMLTGLEISGLAARYRDDSTRRGGPLMVLTAPTLPGRGLGHACSVYGASVLVLPEASREGVQVRASLCTQGEINAALLYATVSVVGTQAALWTRDD